MEADAQLYVANKQYVQAGDPIFRLDTTWQRAGALGAAKSQAEAARTHVDYLLPARRVCVASSVDTTTDQGIGFFSLIGGTC